MRLDEILLHAPDNNLIVNSIVITHAKLERYNRILCSISGGSDSDILIDLCQKYDNANRVSYVFFDTGMEFMATREHLAYLEERYGVNIRRIRACKPVPLCSKLYGQPFLSKQVSEWIERLQRHNFKWEDEPFDKLITQYPECRAALRWWCNDFEQKSNKKESSFNIGYNQYLKEFMIANPPQFSISNKCCYYAKKKVAYEFKKRESFDLNMYGVRKAEGGARMSAYKSCFSSKEEGCDEYRPIFWYLSDTKNVYETHYQIQNSRCYTEYGLKRTGCAGCPYSKNFENELVAMQQYEPQLYLAAINIFSDTYDYTRKYNRFVQEKKNNKEVK